MCDCHSILECCVVFSGVKLSIRSFNLLLMKADWVILKLIILMHTKLVACNAARQKYFCHQRSHSSNHSVVFVS